MIFTGVNTLKWCRNSLQFFENWALLAGLGEKIEKQA